MSSLLLTVQNISKCYRLYARPVDRFKELLLGRRYHEEFWAVREVNLSVKKGVSLGILGENGAGKSTLLKLITGALTPTTGTVAVYGRVASIIELGMGFHPDFSGVENLFVGGALLGFSRGQMEEKIPQIQEFSELGDFLHRPLKHYSTGMGMRLSFSLAVSVEPDLLIVDEALAVGDGYFQKKCVDRIRAFQERGGSLLLCSHSTYQVNALCQQALWLRNGQVELHGPVVQVIDGYEAYLEAKEKRLSEQHWQGHRSGGELKEVTIDGGCPEEGALVIDRGGNVTIQVRWDSERPESLFHLGVVVERVDNVTCFGTTTLKDGLPPFSGRMTYSVALHFPHLPLSNGSFRVIVVLLDEHGVHVYYQKAADHLLTIRNTEKEWGLCYLTHTWKIEAADNENAG